MEKTNLSVNKLEKIFNTRNDLNTFINTNLKNDFLFNKIKRNLTKIEKYIDTLTSEELQKILNDNDPTSFYNTILIYKDELRLNIYKSLNPKNSYMLLNSTNINNRNNYYDDNIFIDIKKSLLKNQINVLLKSLKINKIYNFLNDIPDDLKFHKIYLFKDINVNELEIYYKNYEEYKDNIVNTDYINKLFFEDIRLIGYLTAVKLLIYYEKNTVINKLHNFFNKFENLISNNNITNNFIITEMTNYSNELIYTEIPLPVKELTSNSDNSAEFSITYSTDEE